MANLKAVELLARPPLTDIPERLRILANELPEGLTGVLIVGYPDGQLYNFGEVLNSFEVMGVLYSAANKFKSGHHT